MRRMREEPIIQTFPQPVRRPRAAGHARPTVRRFPSPAPTGVRRWTRLLALSFATVLVSSPLSAAGPSGRMLAGLIGFPAVAVFWVSVIGLPVAAIRARWRPSRLWAPTPSPAHLPAARAAAATRRVAVGSERVRVIGAEDNWVKGARGEHAVGAVLNGTGLPVLHDRRLRAGSSANIDHLVVAGDAVYVVDAKNLTGSLATTGDQLRINGRDRGGLLDGVRRQADEVAAALDRLGASVPVRPVLCLTGTAQPAGMHVAARVLLTTPDTVVGVVTLPGLLTEDRRTRIADLLAWAFPPAVGN